MFKFSKRVPADGTDAVGAILKAAADPKIISFAGGLPAPELFPVEGMKEATDKVYAEHGQQALQYGAAKGVTELRELILKRVKEKENIDAKLENVMVTTGSEQAIDLVGKAFVNPGDTVRKGEKLLTFDKNLIQEKGYQTQTMVLVAETRGKELTVVPKRETNPGTPIMTLK